MALAAGRYWEFYWSSEYTQAPQQGATVKRADSGRFRMTLGNPVAIGTTVAFPVSYSGDWTIDLEPPVNLRPRWTHLATVNGTLAGSVDGVSLVTIFNGSTEAPSGRGLFLDFGTGAATGGTGSLQASYNTIPAAARLAREVNQPGCHVIDGRELCSDRSVFRQESEYFKSGWGPIGFRSVQSYSFSGGAYYTAYRHERLLELVETDLAANDGSTLAPIPWQEAAPLSTPRSGHAAAVFNGEIYVFGGRSGSTTLNSVEIYNPTANAWRSGPPMPKAWSGRVAETVNGKIYLVPGTGNVQIYDPGRNSWVAGAAVPYTRYDASDDSATWSTASGTTPGDYVVVINKGFSGSGKLNAYSYNTSSNRWLPPGSMDSQSICCGAIAVAGDLAYFIGGLSTPMWGTGPTAERSVKAYDMATRRWSFSNGALNTPRSSAQAVTVDGRVFVLGGTSQAGFALRDAETHVPGSGSWQSLPKMLQGRFGFAAVVLDGSVYVIGGNAGGSTPLSSVEVLRP